MMQAEEHRSPGNGLLGNRAVAPKGENLEEVDRWLRSIRHLEPDAVWVCTQAKMVRLNHLKKKITVVRPTMSLVKESCMAFQNV